MAIILAIVAAISIIANIVLWRIIGDASRKVSYLEGSIEEIAFAQGMDLDDDLIDEKFENVTIIMNVFVDPEGSTKRIYDTSYFNKHNVIAFNQYLPRDVYNALGEDTVKSGIIPGCTVCKMKDGRILWRVEKKEDRFFD
jgi:hypothetical protein